MKDLKECPNAVSQVSPQDGKAKKNSSKNSRSVYDNPICSMCQGSGRMIAVQCFKIADGITLVLERQGFKHVNEIKNLDPMQIEPIPAFMNFFEIPQEIKKNIDNGTRQTSPEE